MSEKIKLFYCYAHQDEVHCEQIKKHLSQINRDYGLINWSNSNISPGDDWEKAITSHLNTANIILLLVSSDFLASPHCYKEMEKALDRQKTGTCRVIPILLRPIEIDWKNTPFSHLQVIPEKKKPITSWSDHEEAYVNVAKGIRTAVEDFYSQKVQDKPDNDKVVLQHSAISNTSSVEAISRRSALIKLTAIAGGIAIVGGSITAIGVTLRPALTPAPTPISTRTSAPTPKLGTTLYTYKGHSDAVNSAAWSPDGLLIASGSSDKTVQVWNIPLSGDPFIFKHHTDSVNSVAWSPNGLRIASASNDTNVYVWDAVEGGRILPYTKHTDRVNSVAWSPDGRYIASASSDQTVRVWNVADGTDFYVFNKHTNSVNSVAWSPDGLLIASGSSDKTVQVWNIPLSGNPFSYGNHTDRVNSVAWSPKGLRIASASNDNTVQAWDAAFGCCILREDLVSVNSVAWSPDGLRIASASSDATAQVWDAASGSHVYIYGKHSDVVKSVAWSPDSSRIASASNDKTVRVWEAV